MEIVVMNTELCKQLDKTIEQIINRDLCWSVDVFPETIKEWEKYRWIESYLLRKKQKIEYAERIINVIFKVALYSKSYLYVGDVCKKSLRRYEGYFNIQDMNPDRLHRILKKLIVKDENAIICCTDYEIVISIQLYNTAIYFMDSEENLILKNIIESEGLFFRKS